jgi:transcriptional regulator NrdR family protein
MSSENIKDQIISFIKTLPDDITLEDIMYHLYVREKIFRGIKEADEGKKVSNEEAKEIIEKWFE